MSRQHRLRDRIEKLSGLAMVLQAVRSLALAETRRLSDLVAAQHAAAALVDAIIADFFFHYPGAAPVTPGATAHFDIAIGAERGLCGDFNRRLVETVRPYAASGAGKADGLIIAVGTRMAQAIPDFTGEAIEGASVMEEIPRVAARVAGSLEKTLRETPRDAVPAVWITYQRLESNEHGERIATTMKRLLPFAQPERDTPKTRQSARPCIQLAPEVFLAGALEHYLFLSLQAALHESLLAENRARFLHMERALDELEDTVGHLRRKNARLHQELIVQEIELILLNAEAGPVGSARSAAPL
jgi:F-type H+-transporting ATPase subunit gamma